MWAWFLTTRVGRWLLALGAVLLAVGAAFVGGFEKGKYAEAKTQADKRASDAVAQAQAARETRQAASRAADRIRQDAAKQAPPDSDKRDDLDTTF